MWFRMCCVVVTTFIKHSCGVLFFSFLSGFFIFRSLYVFLYFIVVDLKIGLRWAMRKPRPWCLYKLDEVFFFQILQFIWGELIPLLLFFWRVFLLCKPLTILYYGFFNSIQIFLFWFWYRQQFYNYVYSVIFVNWDWLVWVSLSAVLLICFIVVIPAFCRNYEDSITLARMYDIETDTLLDLVGLFYFCSLPFYMCLASVVLFFFFSLFLILIDTGAVFLFLCEVFWNFLVFLLWCAFRVFGFELRKVDVTVLYIFLLSLFHCLFFYIFVAQIYMFADDIVLTYEFYDEISLNQENLIKNSYLGVMGSYAVVFLYYVHVCNVWGSYFDTRVFRVFLLVYFGWASIPTKYWFSFLAPV
jgi:hypothetical protein